MWQWLCWAALVVGNVAAITTTPSPSAPPSHRTVLSNTHLILTVFFVGLVCGCVALCTCWFKCHEANQDNYIEQPDTLGENNLPLLPVSELRGSSIDTTPGMYAPQLDDAYAL
jgi:hypothetical protein